MDGRNVDVDDLFNEDDLEQAALNIPISGNDVVDSAAHAASLESKIQLDELHVNGCRQRISWSKLGCVASISPDSASVGIRCLRLKKQTATWDLSSAYKLEFPAHGATPFCWTHLCWSSRGLDLAIFDLMGRVSIFQMSTASVVNRFQDLNFPNPENSDELSQAVGTYWLQVADQESPAISQMSKQDEQWLPVVTKRKPIGPIWPRALLVVTRIGTLRLLYMKLDQTWSEAHAILDTPSKTQDLLTQAAFSPMVNGSIFITTHSASGKFSAYSVQVNRPQPLPDRIVTTPITLSVEHIKSDIYSQPVSNSIANSDLMNGASSSDDRISCLSHLEIVPTTDMEKAVQIPPTIFAIHTIYSSTPGLPNSLQAKSSSIQRWSLQTVTETLHPRFDEIPSKNTTTNYTTPKTIRTIERLPTISFDGIITSFHLVESSPALAITSADGTTSFYNPSTMSPIFYESSTQEVTSLSQAGFAFPPTPNPFSIAFSPNACCAVALPPSTSTEPTPILTSMTHPSPLETSTDADRNLEPALAALVLTYSRACYSGNSTDDPLFCILHTVRPNHIPQLLHLILSTLFRPNDFIRQGGPGSEIDKLAKKMLVPRCLSLFAALGVAAPVPSAPKILRLVRSTPARYAWLTLHIRHVAMQLFYVLQSAKALPRLPPDIVGITMASVVWAMSLSRWMVDELCAIDDGEDEAEEGDRQLVALTLGGAWSRFFLKMAQKVLVGLSSPATGTAEEVVRLVREEQGMGLTLRGLQVLLDSAERFSAEMGMREEKGLIAEGEVGGRGFLEKIVREVLPGMRKSGDVDKLAVYTSGMERRLDWTLLEEGNVDVHRKKRIMSLGEVRRCVRCASISEDIGGAKREWPKWLQQQMSRCICEGSFWVEGFDD
jgi:mediator of RNA polymerase II transcription subunit 16